MLEAALKSYLISHDASDVIRLSLLRLDDNAWKETNSDDYLKHL